MNNIEAQEFTLNTNLVFADWFAIIFFLIITIGIGIYFSKKGRKSLSDYFVSGREVPWWFLGTSMVATTFAVETPLAISGLVVKQGIWGNWFWWAQVPQFVIGVYFFSRLWRRARILTDNELIDVRYSGKAATFYGGSGLSILQFPINLLIICWVTVAMTNIFALTFNIPKHWAVVICILSTLSYTSLSGLWGVMSTSFFQFFIAMGMAILLAVVAVNAVGGFGPMMDQLTNVYGADKAGSMLSIIPSMDSPNHAFTIFMLYILLIWWISGFTNGGAFFARRMISAKNEKHSFLGYLWFNIVLSATLVLTITLSEKEAPWTFIYTVPISLSMWLAATILTRPIDEKKLISFYKMVHPGGPGWKRIAAKINEGYRPYYIFTRKNIIGAVAGIIGTYSALIGFGCLILGKENQRLNFDRYISSMYNYCC